jgi:hypothetical protein
MSQNKPEPTADDEWAIHALNIHGLFFERWCQQTIRDTPGLIVTSTNYPVEFPPPKNGVRGREGALDIRAEHHDGQNRLTLIIKCKKNNPEFVNWVFFPPLSPKHSNRISVPVIVNKSRPDTLVGWEVKTDLKRMHLDGLQYADGARETKGACQSTSDDRSKTETSNAVTEAAYQVTLATQAIFWEEVKSSSRRGEEASSTTQMSWDMQALLPVIVTSAHLFTCDFDPKEVDAGSGEIPYDKAKLVEHPYLVFTYTLPCHLQYVSEEAANNLPSSQLERYRRTQIMVVHSGKLKEFLELIIRNAEYLFL